MSLVGIFHKCRGDWRGSQLKLRKAKGLSGRAYKFYCSVIKAFVVGWGLTKSNHRNLRLFTTGSSNNYSLCPSDSRTSFTCVCVCVNYFERIEFSAIARLKLKKLTFVAISAVFFPDFSASSNVFTPPTYWVIGVEKLSHFCQPPLLWFGNLTSTTFTGLNVMSSNH